MKEMSCLLCFGWNSPLPIQLTTFYVWEVRVIDDSSGSLFLYLIFRYFALQDFAVGMYLGVLLASLGMILNYSLELCV